MVKQLTFSLFSTTVVDKFPKTVPGVSWRPSAHRCDLQDGVSCTPESGQTLACSHYRDTIRGTLGPFGFVWMEAPVK